jgi:hypothetical protein
MGAADIIDRYFLEARSRLLDVAAFLDRVDRAPDAEQGRSDYRYRALLRVIGLMHSEPGDRTIACHYALSDPTEEPLASAAGLKGAAGAWRGSE